MEVERLRGLAARLRELLADFDIVVSHSQALDAIAAVSGLRNWPEVQAFPDRIAACTFDLATAGRLQRRLQRDHAFAMPPGALLHLLEMAEFHAVTPARHGTERLIVTTSFTGAGHLKACRIADKVVDFRGEMVRGPVPAAAAPPAFFAAREAAYDADPFFADQLFDWDRAAPVTAEWDELLATCRRYERVDLWIDPSPNEQLLGLQLVDGLAREPDVLAKLFVVHADSLLAGRRAQDIHTMQTDIRKIGPAETRLASQAWGAYRTSTPEAWYELLASDLDAFPFLRRSMLLLLAELPTVGTALGATETKLLQVVSPGGVSPSRFFHMNARDNPERVFRYFEEIRIIGRLSGGDHPAIEGLRDHAFDLAAHQDAGRHRNYMESELSLTPLGRALLAGNVDYADHNPIHRWWGGTLLTNDALWRWDAANQRLVAPR